jgi:hypothetical protein
VWLEDRGWIRVDPTAAVAPERIERGRMGAVDANEAAADRLLRQYPWLKDVRFAWDAANTLWRERVIEFNARSQERLLEWLGISDPDWRALGILLAAGIALALGVLGLQLARELRFQGADPVQRSYERFCRRLERFGLKREAYEGALDFAARVRRLRADLAAECDSITELYLDLRYGNAASATAQSDLVRRVRAFRPTARAA